MADTQDEPSPANADELLAALRLAAEYIQQMPSAPGSIDADVQRLVLAKAIVAIRNAAREEP